MQSGLIQQLGNLGLPQQDIIIATFYLVAGLTVFFALRVVISKNIFHSAIFLAMTLIGIACVYLYLNAEFLAVAQVLIYVGAIVTLFIFVIMLTANIQDRAIRQTNEQVFISAVSAAVFLFILIKVIKNNHWQLAANKGTQNLGIAQLGRSLMTTYVLPFEIISLILIAVLVGAIVIAKSDKNDTT
ncbi:MAG: NADH-quinone oxidoreductase subunit J [Candidatus Omnitrophota bacterium]|nr:NADH-quinone oxidoreductase subunit J [Candidatus Omnitrophota bacterium]